MCSIAKPHFTTLINWAVRWLRLELPPVASHVRFPLTGRSKTYLKGKLLKIFSKECMFQIIFFIFFERVPMHSKNKMEWDFYIFQLWISIEKKIEQKQITFPDCLLSNCLKFLFFICYVLQFFLKSLFLSNLFLFSFSCVLFSFLMFFFLPRCWSSLCFLSYLCNPPFLSFFLSFHDSLFNPFLLYFLSCTFHPFFSSSLFFFFHVLHLFASFCSSFPLCPLPYPSFSTSFLLLQ